MSKVNFQCEGFAKILCDCLGITREELDVAQLEKIKYLYVADEDGGITMEVSTECPPEPFVNTDGGDEWGTACFLGEDIRKFLQHEDTSLDELYDFGYEKDEWEYAWSDEACEKWNAFKESINRIEYYGGEMKGNEWEEWRSTFIRTCPKDIVLLTELEVLRVTSGHFENYQFFGAFKKLRVVEVVETGFEDKAGVENLYNLQQLCCWLD